MAAVIHDAGESQLTDEIDQWEYQHGCEPISRYHPACATSVYTHRRPTEQETAVYHFPRNARSMELDNRVAIADCAFPRNMAVVTHDWNLNRRNTINGPTEETDFKTKFTLPQRTPTQLKEKYSNGYRIMVRNDDHPGRPLGMYGKGHAWPIDPSK